MKKSIKRLRLDVEKSAITYISKSKGQIKQDLIDKNLASAKSDTTKAILFIILGIAISMITLGGLLFGLGVMFIVSGILYLSKANQVKKDPTKAITMDMIKQIAKQSPDVAKKLAIFEQKAKRNTTIISYILLVVFFFIGVLIIIAINQ